ncbi:MAG TPA: MerR family DNA-binding transcriptional regulator [Patescibacteria group bacterium]
MKKLFTIHEAARKLGVSVDTLRRWEKKGKITSERTEGGHRRYSLEEIENIKYRRIVNKIHSVSYVEIPVKAEKKEEETTFRSEYINQVPTQSEPVSLNYSFPLRKFVYILFLFLVLFFLGKVVLGYKGLILSALPEGIRTRVESVIGKEEERFGISEVNTSPSVLAESVSKDLSFDVNINTNLLKDLSVGGNATVSGALTTTGDFTTEGSLTSQSVTTGAITAGAFTGTTGVFTGAVTTGTLTTGNITSSGTLTVAGTSTLTGDATLSGKLTVSGTSKLTGDVTASGALSVSGSSTLSGATTVGSTLNVSGATTLSSLAVTGNATFGNITGVNGVTYSFPATQGVLNSVLTNDASGNLTWTSLAGAGGVTGTGAANQITYWTGTSTVTGNNNFTWNNSTSTFSVGGSTVLGGSTSDLITFTGRVASGTSLIPAVNLGSDLGSSSLKWNNIYAANLNIDSGVTSSGQLLVTYNPTDTTFAQSSIRINVTTPSADEQMLGIGQAGEERAAIDAEGDLTIGYDGVAGSSIPTSSNPLAIYNHGTTEIMTVLANGNVGIGTTNPGTINGNSFSGGVEFQVAGSQKYMALDTSGGAGGILINDSAQSLNNRLWGIDINQPGRLSIATLTDAGAETARLSIDRSGNVGIGTTAPGTTLHAVTTDAATSTSTSVFTVGHNSSGTPTVGFGTGIIYNAQTDTTANRVLGQIKYEWVNVGDATRQSILRATTVASGIEQQAMYISGPDVQSTAFGYRALDSLATPTGYNSAFGYFALHGATSGSSLNTAMGTQALVGTTSGAGNTGFGYAAGITNTTGNYNTLLGYGTNVVSNNLSNATAVGKNATVGCSNCLVLGGTGADAVNVGIGVTNPGNALQVNANISGGGSPDVYAITARDSSNVLRAAIGNNSRYVGYAYYNSSGVRRASLGSRFADGDGATFDMMDSSSNVVWHLDSSTTNQNSWLMANAQNSSHLGVGTTAPATDAFVHIYNNTSNGGAVSNLLLIENAHGFASSNSFGTGIIFRGKSSTTLGRDMNQVISGWQDSTDATRTSYLGITGVSAGGALTEIMRAVGNGYVGIGSTAPGARLTLGNPNGTFGTSNLYANYTYDGTTVFRSYMDAGFTVHLDASYTSAELGLSAASDMEFNIDSDNNDADTKSFIFYKNGSAAGDGRAEIARLTEAGNWGLGTTNPSSKLNVFDSTTTSGDIITATSSGITSGNMIKLGEGGNQTFSGNGIFMDFDNTGGGGNAFTGNFLKFNKNNSTVLTIDNLGNITNSINSAVWTFTTNSGSPGFAFTNNSSGLNATRAFNFTTGSLSGPGTTIASPIGMLLTDTYAPTTAGTTPVPHKALSVASTINETGTANTDYTALQVQVTQTAFGGTTNYLANFLAGTNSVMVIDYDGQVGIGVTNPTLKLQVNGDTGITAGNKMYLSITDVNQYISNAALSANTSGGYPITNVDTAGISLGIGATKGLTVSGASALVGIGTTNPLNTLDVSSSSTSTASAMIRNTSTNATISGLGIKLSSTTLDTTSHFIDFLDLNGTIIGKVQAANTTSVNYAANGTDMAEYFTKDSSVFTPGDLVSQGSNGATLTTSTYDSKMIGIVSTAPSFTGGVEGPNKVLVALVGQVPVKISSTSSPINPGDYITSSSEAGKAMKAINPGYTIGKALEAWDPSSGKTTISVAIHNSYFEGDLSGQIAQLKTDVANLTTDISLMKLSTSSATVATDSATFTNITVLGSTVLADTVVNGKLNIGTLTIDNATSSIDAIGVLKLQSLSLGNVEIMGGKVTIDTKGNIIISSGHVAGNSSFRDTQVLPAGAGSTYVARTWDTAPSGVTVNADYDTYVWVTDITKDGFMMHVKNIAPTDSKLYWTAIW